MRSQYTSISTEGGDNMMGDVVTVDLTDHDPNTPLGMLLAPATAPTSSSASATPAMSNVTILAGWEHLPNGNRLGPIQRSGLVRLGDRLVHINNVDVTHMTFRDVMDLLKNMLYMPDGGEANGNSPSGRGGGIILRSMGFAPIGGKDVMSTSSSLGTYKDGTQRGIDMSKGMLPSPQNQRLYTFRSSIHRARVRIVKEEGSLQSDVSSNGSVTFFLDDENKKRPSDKGEAFVEYEISCHLVIHFRGGGASYRIGGKGEQQTWNVWKRYSEFKVLDEKLRKAYGWHFDSSNNGRGLLFPPGRVLTSFFGGALNSSFVESRRKELEEYWQSLHTIDAIFDFSNPSSHRFSRDLASFISLENHLFRHRSSTIPNHSSWANERTIPENSATIPIQTTTPVSLAPSEDQDDSSTWSGSMPLSGIEYDNTAMLKDEDSHALQPMNETFNATHGNETISTPVGALKSRNTPRRRKRASRAAKPAFQRQFDT